MTNDCMRWWQKFTGSLKKFIPQICSKTVTEVEDSSVNTGSNILCCNGCNDCICVVFRQFVLRAGPTPISSFVTAYSTESGKKKLIQ